MRWHARISPKPLIIVAASARAFVRAAAATGRRVIAADVFCDVDTFNAAERAFVLKYQDGGFDPEDVRSRIVPLMPHTSGFLYGSGFETQPELLDELARHGVVYGNTAETVRQLKDPHCFFPFLAACNLQHPAWTLGKIETSDNWISKLIGGSGGVHIADADHVLLSNRYLQRKHPGRSISLLFAADGEDVVVIGYNQQLISPVSGMPFRYGGAVSQISLSERIRGAMLHAAECITREFALRGLNSLDCIVDDEQCWILEINPRLSATFALYDAAHEGAVLLESHMQASRGLLPPPLPEEPSQAHLIYYAPFDLTIPAALKWPEWVADIPAPASQCREASPLCTVMASALDADKALSLAYARYEALTVLLTNLELKVELS